MADKLLYPFVFYPILKERVWGGNKLMDTYGKISDSKNIGESWEVSGVKGNISKVSNGPLKGKSLQQLIRLYASDFLGHKVMNAFGSTFPILIKFIDARSNLSVQLHPDDQIAKERHDSFGKTEMWYIMEADDRAKLVMGFNEGVSREDYLYHLENGSLMEILREQHVETGDTFFIETGTVHAIGGGIVLAEIQQTSDITYRIYDYDRLGTDGSPRELHTDLALDAINFNSGRNSEVKYSGEENCSNKMVDTPYFITNFIPVRKKMITKLSERDSFSIYICVKGDVRIETEWGKADLHTGETIVLPACIDQVSFLAENANLLEVYL